MKHKGIIALSIAAGLVVTALIIGLSFSGPDNNNDGSDAVLSDNISAGDSPSQTQNASGYYRLDEDGRYYRLEQDDISVKDKNVKAAGTWEINGGTISLFADE